VDGAIKRVGASKGLVSEMMGFEIVPDNLNVIELGGVLGQSFDGEPVGAGGQRRDCCLAHVDRPIVEYDDDRLHPHTWLGAVKTVEHLQERNQVGAALGSARVHDEPAGGVIECPPR
jgi:hypothetical protein